MRKNIMSVPIAQHSMLENHFICNTLRNVVHQVMQIQLVGATEEEIIVIDEVDEEEFDLSDLSIAFTQFDNKVSYSLEL